MKTGDERLSPPVSALQGAAVWLALCVLAVGSLLLSYAPLGPTAGSALALGLGAIKSGLIAAFFMHLSHARAMPVIMALGAVVFVGLLAGLVGLDVASRIQLRVPVSPADAASPPIVVPSRHARRTDASPAP